MCDPDTVSPMVQPEGCGTCGAPRVHCMCPWFDTRHSHSHPQHPLRPNFTIAELVEAFDRWLEGAPHADQS